MAARRHYKFGRQACQRSGGLEWAQVYPDAHTRCQSAVCVARRIASGGEQELLTDLWMTGNSIWRRDCKFPMRFLVPLWDFGQSIFSKQTRTGVTKNVHLEPGFVRLFDKQPAVGFAGIKEKFPVAAFAASLACFYSFRSAHRIHLSWAMSLVCSGSLRLWTGDRQTTSHSIVRRAGSYRLYKWLTTRPETETFRRQYRPQGAAIACHLPQVSHVAFERPRKQNPPTAGFWATPVV